MSFKKGDFVISKHRKIIVIVTDPKDSRYFYGTVLSSGESELIVGDTAVTLFFNEKFEKAIGTVTIEQPGEPTRKQGFYRVQFLDDSKWVIMWWNGTYFKLAGTSANFEEGDMKTIIEEPVNAEPTVETETYCGSIKRPVPYGY